MAVYTQVSSEALAQFLEAYGIGSLLSAKGIAEGVSNSNYLVETSAGRFVLTLYERRIAAADLPFFIGLMEHLAHAGLPVPRPVRDRAGVALKQLAGRDCCLVQYLPGVSVTQPTAAQCRAAGAALAALHRAGVGFAGERANGLGPAWWAQAADSLAGQLDRLQPGLDARVATALSRIATAWPDSLPAGIIHADLFPDNVLMLGDRVSGLIDFYFACTGPFAYDLAILLAAWTFAADGSAPDAGLWSAAVAGYEGVRPLQEAERQALPLMGVGASLRFLLSRAQDWFAPNEPAMLSRKDPLPFARRLAWFADRADA